MLKFLGFIFGFVLGFAFMSFSFMIAVPVSPFVVAVILGLLVAGIV